jgi:LmbE family N-acetylglucosaminyl deacetylase
MKVLVVAHPDDEALWFNPAEFDRIVIVFGDRDDKPEKGAQRSRAMVNHPLRDKIKFLDWREPGKDAERQKETARELTSYLKAAAVEATEVTTHNAHGEYGHMDHVIVHNACMAALKCPVNGKDPALFRAIKQAYLDAGCWTWH